ncbi:MAG: hypothetical protein AAGG48_07300 [Planctomycetota bacterium]
MLFYLQTLLLTLGIELVVIAIVTRCLSVKNAQAVLSTCVCINLLTHPLAFLTYHWIGVPFVALELAVFVIEFCAYRFIARASLMDAFALSATSNLVSLLAGLILF